MIVAITGGTGFIGRRLVLAHLAKGDAVRVLSRKNPQTVDFADKVEWHDGDLTMPETIRRFAGGADVLYHCAGEIRDAARMRAVHVDGTRALIGAAQGNIGRWVQLSSVGAYGAQRQGMVTEQTEPKPIGEYEITKTESDALVEKAFAAGAFETAILRPSNVYGAEMSNQSLFGLIAMIRRGLFFFIGPEGASANYIHVDNVVEALLRCGGDPRAKGQTYNLSDHRKLEQFVTTISGLLGCPVPATRLPEYPVRLAARLFGGIPGFPLTEARVDALTVRSQYSTSKIERELDYRHVVSMEAGLEGLVASWLQRTGAKQ